jgi:hypothetical protein
VHDAVEKDKEEFNAAWENHKEKNPHHWENWTKKEGGWVCNCVCMVVDWMAMGMKFNDTPREYYEKNKDKIKLPNYAIKFMYKIFELLEATK